MAERIEWTCPGCSRQFRIPIGNAPSLCPDCQIEMGNSKLDTGSVKMKDEWYYQTMGEEMGPISTDRLTAMAQNNTITRETLVKWKEDGEWIVAESLPELFSPLPSESMKVEKSLDELGVDWIDSEPKKKTSKRDGKSKATSSSHGETSDLAEVMDAVVERLDKVAKLLDEINLGQKRSVVPSIANSAKTEPFAVASFALALSLWIYASVATAPIILTAWLTATSISYYKLKEDDSIAGWGLRLAGVFIGVLGWVAINNQTKELLN